MTTKTTIHTRDRHLVIIFFRFRENNILSKRKHTRYATNHDGAVYAFQYFPIQPVVRTAII